MGDWIAPVEAAYELDGTLDDWLRGVVASASRALDGDAGLAGWVYELSPGAFRVLALDVAGADPSFAAMTRETLDGSGRERLRPLLVGPPLGGTLSTMPHGDRPLDRSLLAARTDDRFRDVFGLISPTATGLGVVLGGPMRQRQPTSPAAAVRHARVAAHVGAGLRLRAALERAGGAAEEAVLDPAATLHDAQGPARSPRARDVLRRAVLDRERARTRAQRSDPDHALALWEGLVAGRWSLVDRFDGDGKRFVVARPNAPDFGHPRGLTPRERLVAEYLGTGRSVKEISYLLGIGAPAVSNAIARAATRLGLRGRVELALFFAPTGLRARLAEIELLGERLAAGTTPPVDAAQLAGLTEAEREIALDLVHGWTNQAIAARRETSPLTIETQCKAIYAKLGVHSRVELAARLGAAD